MNISEDQINVIIERAVEKALLMIPEVVGNLITHHVSINKINKDFYKKYPDLREHKELVASVIEQVEGNNPPMDYQKLIDKALPFIKDRIETTSSIDLMNVDVPSLDFNGVF